MKANENIDIFSSPSKEKILRLEDVKARTGLSRSTIYLNIHKGTFPQHINLGSRCVGWLESDIDTWIEQRIAISRANRNSNTS